MNLTDRLLTLKKVKQEDCELLWKWANDPSVRAASFSPEPITWEDHVKWFNSKLNSPNCYQFIALNNEGKPIGQIRFDIDSELQAEIDVSIDPNERGKGYASNLIKISTEYLFNKTSIQIVNAMIKVENLASIKSFIKAGFKFIDQNISKDNFHVYNYVTIKKDQTYTTQA